YSHGHYGEERPKHEPASAITNAEGITECRCSTKAADDASARVASDETNVRFLADPLRGFAGKFPTVTFSLICTF
ncbi:MULTISPECIES: hypothetical protein, partial [Streptomyces]|uniref:hypothetical protein n=1 Tax=Streptomyces TaxID=1883 RepID=UPI0019636AEF